MNYKSENLFVGAKFYNSIGNLSTITSINRVEGKLEYGIKTNYGNYTYKEEYILKGLNCGKYQFNQKTLRNINQYLKQEKDEKIRTSQSDSRREKAEAISKPDCKRKTTDASPLIGNSISVRVKKRGIVISEISGQIISL